VNTGRFGP